MGEFNLPIHHNWDKIPTRFCNDGVKAFLQQYIQIEA